MVGGVLVERTVNEVLPALEQNKDQVENLDKIRFFRVFCFITFYFLIIRKDHQIDWHFANTNNRKRKRNQRVPRKAQHSFQRRSAQSQRTKREKRAKSKAKWRCFGLNSWKKKTRFGYFELFSLLQDSIFFRFCLFILLSCYKIVSLFSTCVVSRFQ